MEVNDVRYIFDTSVLKKGDIGIVMMIKVWQ